MELRDYQIELSQKLSGIIGTYGIAYLAAEVRTGKTLTVLNTAKLLGKKKVLFVTKKGAISSIEKDYHAAGFDFMIKVINHESLDKVPNDFDFVICDESHACFVGDTIVDEKKIKDIRVGDFLKTYNFTENKIEQKKVLAVSEKPLTGRLVKIKAGGKEIICTEDHEIYTKEGWKKAKNITKDDELYTMHETINRSTGL